MNGPDHQVEQFARRFFELAGARAEQHAAGLRVELTNEQLELMEGRRPWGFRPPDDGLTTFYFAFDEERAVHDERAELLGPGTFRLQQLCEAASRVGALGRVFIRPPRPSAATYRPYIVFHFLVTYIGHDVRERTASIAVDLVTGDAFPCPPLPDEPLHSTSGGGPSQSPRFSVGEAHERAVDVLCGVIAKEDSSWFHEKWNWIERELDRLYTYLHRASDEHPSDEALASLREARMTELRELSRPRVELRAAAATLLYAPEGRFP